MQKNIFKSYQIENRYYNTYLTGIINEAIKRSVNMENNLIDLQNWSTSYRSCYNVGKGGHHIWISDLWGNRIAILYYTESN